MSTTTPHGLPSPDAGLFGPGSVTWRVHADPLTGLAGLRSVLLQALHPVAAAMLGSGREDLWSHAARAGEYLAVTTFGSLAEAATAAARLRAELACHRGATSDAIFHADAEHLLVWAHVCRVESFLSVVRRGGLDLDDAEADAYVAEQVRAAVLVGLEPDAVPDDAAGLRRAVEARAAQLWTTPQARTALATLLTGPRAPLAGLALASLPAWARHLYDTSDLPDVARLPDPAVTLALHAARSRGL